MSLTTGTRIGAFEITGTLGVGGMGEVYRARDTKLDREVAIKVLPELFAQDPERMARFEREAKTLASLNDPHIAQIYGLETSAGVHALVLELVDGPTLADRIARGPIPLGEALPIARQIVEALETAHEQGIVHRDLKPANIKVRDDGTAKVLDFGLAKMLEHEAAAPALSMSPTLSAHATVAGVILGTAAYMSPEQARGKPVDRRTDVWAFGCVLFEMLAGQEAFEPGETVSDAVAAILSREPDWRALPGATSESIRALLRRCLTKDPRGRLQAIGEARIAIERAIAEPAEAVAATGPAARLVPETAGWRRALPWAIAGVLAITSVASLLLLAPWRADPRPATVRVSAELGVDASTSASAAGLTAGSVVALSPDGTLLAFAARDKAGVSQLFLRRLEKLEATALPGTINANSPVFSPDSQWIAFWADNKLKKIAVTGGAAVPLLDTPFVRGVTWTEADTIMFSPSNGGVLRVSSAGGTPEPVSTRGDGAVHRWPHVLPGGKAVLFTTITRTGEYAMEVQPLPTGTPKIVMRGATSGRYLPSGHLVYVFDRTLFAAPFDLDRLAVTGQAVPVLDDVASNGTGGAHFTVSDTGILAYLAAPTGDTGRPIEWMDRRGTTTPLRAVSADWANLVFASDGRRLALDISDGSQTDVWVYDVARERLSRLTSGGTTAQPVWTPDGSRLAFSSRRDGQRNNIYWQRADGTGEVQRLTASTIGGHSPSSWHPNGKLLAFWENDPQTRDDIWILPIDGDEKSGWKPGQPTAFLKTPAAERMPMFSPDGKWLAYHSTETGRDEVWVRSFPDGHGEWQISTEGGTTATWSRTKPELFYQTPDQHIMVVTYSVDGDVFRADTPRLLSESRFVALRRRGPTRSFDLHPDGNRFALAKLTETEGGLNKVVFIFNFFDQLRRVAPAGK